MRKRFKEDISLLAEFYRQCKGELSLVNIRGYLLNNEIRYTSKELAELSTQLLLNSETDAARLMEIAFFVNNDQICRDIVCTSDAVRQVRDTN